jgi:hypothetical protein
MRRISKTVRYILIVMLCSLSVPLINARADVAPPEQAPGSSIEPAQPTRVQMAAESIVIDVLNVKGKGVSALPLASVTANFTMRNAGDADESMVVRFPISDPSGDGDGFGGQPEIDNIVVKVNGRTVPTRVVTTPNPRGEGEPPIKWAAFEVTFPQGKDTRIDVSYILQSTGYMPYGAFRYILETGAGWDGPIGQADITVKLPYPATEENVVLAESTEGGRIENGEVKWSFTDLEPTRDSNFAVTVLAPNIWGGIVNAREAVQRSPNNADAWRALARAYRAAVFVKYGPQTGANFVPQIEDAYRQAQQTDPTSAQAHAELAQALLDLNQPIFDQLPKELADKVFAELQAALKLDPRNATAVKLAGEVRTLLESLVSAGNPDAQAQLDQLNTLITETGAQVEAPAQATTVPTAPPIAPAGTVTPTEAISPTETVTATEGVTPTVDVAATDTVTPTEAAPVVTTETVSETTPAGVIVTVTVMTSTERVVTDPVTAQPVTVTEMTATNTVTRTDDVTGTRPVVVIVIQSNSVATATAPTPEGEPAQVVTVTTSTSESSPVVDGQVVSPTEIVTSTVVVTTSTEVITDATTSQPITVTTVTESETSVEAPAGVTEGVTEGLTETVPTQTKIEETVVTTQTAPNPETGAVVVVTGTTRSIEIAPTVNITVNVPPAPTQIVTQTEIVTATTEASAITPTIPATITVIVQNDTVTQNAGDEDTPPSVVTETETTTRTEEPNPIEPTLPATITVIVQNDTVTQSAGDADEAPSVVTSTDVTTRTETANPIEPTLPATVTEVTTSQDVTATTAITGEAGVEAGAPIVVTTTETTQSVEEVNPIEPQMPATRTETSTTQVVTETGSVSEPGARVVVSVTVVTTGTMPMPGDPANPPPMEQVQQTEVVTTTVDAAGQVTTTPPIISVITQTLPVLPLPTRAPRPPRLPAVQATPEAQATPAVDAGGTVTATEGTTATVEAGTPAATAEAGAGATDATPAATAEAGTTPATGEAPAAQGNTLLGIPTEALLPLGIVYVLGFVSVFLLWRRRFNNNKI